ATKEGVTYEQGLAYARAFVSSDYFGRFFMDWSDGSNLGGTSIASNFFQTKIDQVWDEEEDEWTKTRLSSMRNGIEALMDLITNHEGGKLEYFCLRLVPSKEVLEKHGFDDSDEVKEYFGAYPVALNIAESHGKFQACLAHNGAIENVEEMRDFEKRYRTNISDFYKEVHKETSKIVADFPELRFEFFEE
ncbi:hypothetical protein KY336_03485, partial [Candidatus Woesearchaeota archaeon]|nr:hypothetical protein [Candidatus Woesearchaeota archaeon]